MNDLVGIVTSCFMLLFVVVSVSFLWIHLAVRQMERNAAGEKLTDLPQFAELEGIHDAAKHGRGTGAAISDWRPEDPDFWARTGNRIAQRNLWNSIPCLLLAFAVWMVWSVVVAPPEIGRASCRGRVCQYV